MKLKRYFRWYLLLPALLIVLFGSIQAIGAWTPLPVSEDPLVRMPGTQPDQNVSIDDPDQCTFCHFNYDSQVEPGYNWQGSMMSQAGRDFLFWADMVVASQDSIWALGNPNASDLCLRCHMPKGWLEGRSDPPNASMMTGYDYDGVQCGFCHQLYNPFYLSVYDGTREGDDWLNYWDETNQSGTPSQAAADRTLAVDSLQSQNILLFSGQAFFEGDLPFSSNYIENAGGQFFVSTDRQRRGPFADARSRHESLYNRYHRSKYFCSTCHDVSNPALANMNADPSQPLPSEEDSAYTYYHVERTFSEFMLSAYGQQGGAPGVGPYAPEIFETSMANNYIARCQDCHMRDVRGQGASRMRPPTRPDGSIEHPETAIPRHAMTGGNAWVSAVLASAISGSSNYDAVNNQLLNQGAAVLTLDLSQGMGINPDALMAGADRAILQLEEAASLQNVIYNPDSGALSFQVQNQTGHKLISGFPEGRRMFLNIKAYNGSGSIIYELNPYDYSAGTLRGLDPTYSPNSPALQANEVYIDEFVYEMKPTSELTGETKSFHFALATGRYKDNRIPPIGFDISSASTRIAEPVWGGVPDPNYFTAEEYAGGYDAVELQLPLHASRIAINLYYQTTSREYIEFLRDEINGDVNLTLPEEAYIIQTDPFFSQLKAWGDTIWELWTHNMQLPGAAPVQLTQATWQGSGSTCTAPVPHLLSANPADSQVSLSWTDEHTTDSQVTGYNVYYDLSGGSQLIVDAGLATSYIDSGLTNSQEYCYKVTSYYGPSCESGFSNVLCATPVKQTTLSAGVSTLETGTYQVAGDPTSYIQMTTFTQGTNIIFRTKVIEPVSGQLLPGAIVNIQITGPTNTTIISGPSDAQGIAEASWQTQASRGFGRWATGGTPTGAYTAAVTSVTMDGYSWDGVQTSVSFTIQ